MKAVKFLFKAAIWLVVIIVVAILALPLWIGPVAKGVANSVVPGITGTEFHLGEFGLNQYAGSLHVGDMQLANPKGFDEKNAVELTKFDANFAMTSLFSGKKYRVESVVLDGLVVYSDPKAANFRQIAANATSGRKTGEKPEAKPEPAPEKTPEAKPAEEGKKGKGVQIDHLVIDNITLKIGVVPMKVPTKIEIDGIGADKEEGASLEEIAQIVYSKVLTAAGAVGGALGNLGKGAVDAVKDVDLSAAQEALDAGDIKGAKKALKDAGKSVKDAVKGIDMDGAKDSLKDAGNNLKNLFK